MKAPLLEYLDKLEATAWDAPGSADGSPWAGDWERLGRIVAKYAEDSVVMIADKASPRGTAHIVATQPRATIRLIAKLREAVNFAKELSADICDHPSTGELVRATLQRKIDALLEIEVSE